VVLEEVGKAPTRPCHSLILCAVKSVEENLGTDDIVGALKPQLLSEVGSGNLEHAIGRLNLVVDLGDVDEVAGNV